MVHVTDFIPPEIISDGELADAMNANCSMRTNTGRNLDLLQIAIINIYRQQTEINELRAIIERMQAGK